MAGTVFAVRAHRHTPDQSRIVGARPVPPVTMRELGPATWFTACHTELLDPSMMWGAHDRKPSEQLTAVRIHRDVPLLRLAGGT